MALTEKYDVHSLPTNVQQAVECLEEWLKGAEHTGVTKEWEPLPTAIKIVVEDYNDCF